MKKFIGLALAIILACMPLFAIAEEEVENYFQSESMLAVGSSNYDMSAEKDYTVFCFEPGEIGKFTISVDNGLIGIVSYITMWVQNMPSEENVNSTSVEWDCTDPNQGLIVAVKSDSASVNITVETESIVIKEIQWTIYENTHTPEAYTFDGDAEMLEYIDIEDDVIETAVLGDDGFMHLNSADGPVLYADLDDTYYFSEGVKAVISTTSLKYVTEPEVSGIDYTEAFSQYVNAIDSTEGLYPLTQDLVEIFQNGGIGKGWYDETGLLGTNEDAWMFCCAYLPEEESDDSSDVVEESSDVVEESSDVVEESSDVVEESSDVVDDSSDVVEDSSDVVEDSSDVVEESSGVVEESSDVVEESSDVVEESSDEVEEESDIEDVVGAPNENASFTVDISAPDYKAGEQVIVTVTINGITAENGLHTVELDLYFDNSKMSVVPAEEGSSAVSAMAEFAEWEDMTKFETLEDGTVIVKVGAGTPGTSTGKFTPAVSDGQLVFNIPFNVLADAEGEINVWAPNANVKGSFINGDTGEIYEYTGNAGYVVLDAETVIEESSDVESSDVETSVPATPATPTTAPTPETGDASAMIFFAIIALVALAGSAVVIKTRK